MYTRNSMGPSTVPWATLEVTAMFSDVVFSKSTATTFLLQHAWAHLRISTISKISGSHTISSFKLEQSHSTNDVQRRPIKTQADCIKLQEDLFALDVIC
jgi:hypothetical protein